MYFVFVFVCVCCHPQTKLSLVCYLLYIVRQWNHTISSVYSPYSALPMLIRLEKNNKTVFQSEDNLRNSSAQESIVEQQSYVKVSVRCLITYKGEDQLSFKRIVI
jgi:hypothetical protein